MICDKIEICKDELKHSKATLIDRKGGKSKFLIEKKANSKCYIIDFENCVYEDKYNETKCDFGLLTNSSIYYIELKGSDVVKGIKQILATINETEKCFDGLNKKSRLVVSRFPKPDITKRRKEYIDLVKKIGSTKEIIITQNVYKEII